MRTSSTVWPVLLTGLLASAGHAQEAPKLEDATARASYSLGYQMGKDFRNQDLKFDRAAVLQGLKDGVSGAEPGVPVKEMQELIAEVKRKIVANAKKEHEAKLEANKQAGIAFLEENKSKPGVHTTESGLQYKVIEEGSGKQPSPTDRVRVQYRGRTVEGVEFDSSYKRDKPADLTVSEVIKGWSEGLQLMKEGAKYEFYVPYELAYDARPPLAYQTLIFDVELLEVNPESAQSEASKPEKK